MSKKQQLGNRFDDYGADKAPDVRTFGTGELDEDMFAALDSVPISSETIGIDEIRADITQPRRIVPREVRGAWNGTAKGVSSLLDAWAEACGVSDDMVRAVLEGKSSVHGLAGDAPVLAGFVKLLDLASQIHDVGLQQRIGVSTVTGGYQIIYGERRWMAFQCLAHWVSDEYRAIPAKVASVSPWELAKIQAAENFQRDELNAIEKARQFAKLLIISRGDSDVTYDPWEALVVEGGCDRPYYAQVADGNIHRIPRGMGEQFESALGISTITMRKYRNLLKLTEDYEVNNSIWTIADEYGWAENFMYEVCTQLELKTIQDILYRSSPNGIDNVEKLFRDALDEAKSAKRETPPPTRNQGGGLETDEPLHVPTITRPAVGRAHGLVQNDDERVSQLPPNPVQNPTETPPPAPPRNQGGEQGQVSQLPPNPVQNPTLNSERSAELRGMYLNKRVVMRDGRMGTVRDVRGDSLRVHFDDGATPWLGEGAVELVHYTIPSQPSPIEADAKHSVPTPADNVDDGDLVDKQPREVHKTLVKLIELAAQLGMDEARQVIVNLYMATQADVAELSKLSVADSDAVLSSYEAKVAHLLEASMKHVENYTLWIREQVADARAAGA